MDDKEYKFSETDIGANTSGQQDFHTEPEADYKIGSGMPESRLSQLLNIIDFAKLKDSLRNLNWRRLAVPGGITLAIIALYFLFTFQANRKNSALERQNQMAMVQPTMPAEPATDYSRILADDSRRMDELSNSVQQKIDALTRRMIESDARLAKVSDATADNQKELAELKQNINILVDGIKQMLIDINQLKQQNRPNRRATTVPRLIYNVLAVVPGRAWLRSERGEVVTLRVGDRLPGYGTVKAISVNQSMVVMSDGSIIQFAVD